MEITEIRQEIVKVRRMEKSFADVRMIMHMAREVDNRLCFLSQFTVSQRDKRDEASKLIAQVYNILKEIGNELGDEISAKSGAIDSALRDMESH